MKIRSIAGLALAAGAASLAAASLAAPARPATSPARAGAARPEVSDHGIPLTPKGVQPGGPMNQNLGDMDYGVCRGIDPACFHSAVAPKITPTTQFRVLLFTHTAGPRHADLGTAFPAGAGLNPPLAANNVVQAQMKRLAAENGFALDYTEDPAQLGSLSRYNAVIFFSTSRDALDDAAQTSLRQFMRSGGGFVGIHNAFGTEYNWPYYEGLLGGANYYDHGAERNGDVVIVDKYDASTKALPAKFGFRDEWYNLVPFPTHVRFLATVDEKSFTAVPRGGAAPGGAPGGAPGAAPGGRGGGVGGPPGGAPPAGAAAGAAAGAQAGPPAAGGRGGGGRGGGAGGPAIPAPERGERGHGTFHPVAWCQYYDGGKSWVTTLGHDAGDFSTVPAAFPGALEFQKLIIGGIKSVMGMEPFCQ